MATPSSSAPVGFGAVCADLAHVESYVGKDDGKTRYLARTEFPACEGSRWSSVRCTVLSPTPFDAGRWWCVVTMYDGNKGEARARLIRRADA